MRAEGEAVVVHASAEMEHQYPVAVGRAQAHLSIADPGTATEAPISGFY